MEPRTKLIGGLIIIAIAAVSLLAFARCSRNGTQYTSVQKGNVLVSVYGIGTIESDQVYQVRLGIASILEKKYCQVGELIQKDQALIRMQDIGEIRAPFTGVVTELNYEAGEAIFPQMTILSLVNFEKRYLTVSLEQSGALKVKPGQKAKLSFEGFREKTFLGTVVSVYSSNQRLFARIETPDLDSRILPGMTADVGIIVKELQNVLLVDSNAILMGQVTLRSGDEVAVEIGALDEQRVQVLSDQLKEGDQVKLHVPARP